MTYSGYHLPVMQNPTAPSSAPRCWGKDFDNESRECSRCGFQSSCKSEIYRVNAQNPRPQIPVPVPYPVPMMAPQSYAQPMQPYPRLAPPVPPPTSAMVMSPVVGPTGLLPPVQRSAVQVQPAVHAQPAPVALPQQYGGFFGWMNDPLYGSLESSPPPFRPQMQGESFGERILKNILLAASEQALKQMVTAVRQIVWRPPTPRIPTIPPPPGAKT